MVPPPVDDGWRDLLACRMTWVEIRHHEDGEVTIEGWAPVDCSLQETKDGINFWPNGVLELVKASGHQWRSRIDHRTA